MDRRGNWRVSDYTLDQASVNETRTRNGVNEYLEIDADGPLDPVTLVYDDNGNLTLDPLAPSAQGKLGATGVPPVTIQHIYSGAAAIAEHRTCDGGSCTLVRELLWGERFPAPLALVTHGGESGGVGGPAITAGETAYHYLRDGLGTVVAQSDQNGVEVERCACEPYGKTIIEQVDPQSGENAIGESGSLTVAARITTVADRIGLGRCSIASRS